MEEEILCVSVTISYIIGIECYLYNCGISNMSIYPRVVITIYRIFGDHLYDDIYCHHPQRLLLS